MGLREEAEKDLGILIEDRDTGFGWDITITDPDGAFADVIGSSNDITEVIDPDTGVAVSGRLATVSLRQSTLKAKGLSIPVGIIDKSLKPWIVEFLDIAGEAYKFKVRESNPDRTLGLISLILETYN